MICYSPDTTHTVGIALIVVVLITIVEILVPCVAATVLRTTPIVCIGKATDAITHLRNIGIYISSLITSIYVPVDCRENTNLHAHSHTNHVSA